MKRLVVAGLLRLYPSRWRAEYGGELAEILMRRPLGAGGIVNVAANGIWQQLRIQEPWLIVGAPLTLWIVIAWAILLTRPDLTVRLHGGSPAIGFAVFCGVGLWTVIRQGNGGGRAAMRVAMIVALPYFVLGMLTLAQMVRVVEGPAGVLSFRLYGPPSDAPGTFRLFVEIPILQIPFAGLLGWLGGLAGRLVRAVQ